MASAYLAGNYNNQIARIVGATKSFVLPLPSLTLSDTGATDISAILSTHRLVYTGYRSLPATYHL